MHFFPAIVAIPINRVRTLAGKVTFLVVRNQPPRQISRIRFCRVEARWSAMKEIEIQHRKERIDTHFAGSVSRLAERRIYPGIEGEESRSVDIMHWIRHKCTLGANWPGFPRFVLHLSLERATASFSSIPQNDARTRYHGHKRSSLFSVMEAKWMPANLGYYVNALVNKAGQHIIYNIYILFPIVMYYYMLRVLWKYF